MLLPLSKKTATTRFGTIFDFREDQSFPGFAASTWPLLTRLGRLGSYVTPQEVCTKGMMAGSKTMNMDEQEGRFFYNTITPRDMSR